MKEKRREISYDVIRCVAMLFVIAVHANPKPYQSGSLWQELFLAVFFSCNGLFFMLSGRFALAKKLDGVRGILTFYRRKLFSVFIPLVFFGAIYCLVDLYQDGVPFTFGMFLETAAKGLTGDLRDTYLWFMFVLIGLTLVAPFLGKMVQRMTDSELHLLAAIGLIWEILSIYIGKNAGLGFGYSGWLFEGWPYYYFLGYYVFRVFEKKAKAKKILIIVGAAAFILNSLWSWLMPEYSYNAHDLAPLYTVFIVGLYLLLGSAKPDPESGFGRLIAWVAAQSYFVYLIHRILAKLWIDRLNWFPGKVADYLVHLILCLILSLAAAFLLNLIYRPVKKKLG